MSSKKRTKAIIAPEQLPRRRWLRRYLRQAKLGRKVTPTSRCAHAPTHLFEPHAYLRAALRSWLERIVLENTSHYH